MPTRRPHLAAFGEQLLLEIDRRRRFFPSILDDLLQSDRCPFAISQNQGRPTSGHHRRARAASAMGIGRRLLLEPEHPTEGSRQPRGPYASDASFDTNMVIILAALLCALVFALGLNSIVRCALRFGRRSDPGSGGRGSQGTGLKKKALRAIPVTEYSGANMPATECPICLGEFAEGEKVRVLPKCNHGFHVRCIDTWLGSHSSCPTCRSSLLALAAGSSRPAENRPEQPASAGETPGPPAT